jgi:hypothetical protein
VAIGPGILAGSVALVMQEAVSVDGMRADRWLASAELLSRRARLFGC